MPATSDTAALASRMAPKKWNRTPVSFGVAGSGTGHLGRWLPSLDFWSKRPVCPPKKLNSYRFHWVCHEPFKLMTSSLTAPIMSMGPGWPRLGGSIPTGRRRTQVREQCLEVTGTDLPGVANLNLNICGPPAVWRHSVSMSSRRSAGACHGPCLASRLSRLAAGRSGSSMTAGVAYRRARDGCQIESAARSPTPTAIRTVRGPKQLSRCLVVRQDPRIASRQCKICVRFHEIMTAIGFDAAENG